MEGAGALFQLRDNFSSSIGHPATIANKRKLMIRRMMSVEAFPKFIGKLSAFSTY